MVQKRKLVGAVLVAFSCGTFAASTASTAAATETAASIREAVDGALRNRLADTKNVTAEIGAIDARLRLPSCPALEVNLPPVNTATMTAKVECQSPNWTIYVPVQLHSWAEVMVAATNLAPNTKLTAAELTRGRVDMFAVPGGLVTEPGRAAGKVLRVGVIAGSPILASHLQNPLVVRRGEQVQLAVSDKTMTIRNTVVALEDGRIGDSIAVQNQQTRKTIHATVADDGTVQIKF